MDFFFTRENPSIFFRNADFGSMLTSTWKDGLVHKGYNGRIAGRTWPLPHQPETAEAFEQWCRSAFHLNCLWTVRKVSGFETARQEAA